MGSILSTYGRVQVDKDGTGNIFAATGFGEEGLKGSALAELSCVGIGATVGLETMLKKVPEKVWSVEGWGAAHRLRSRTAPRRCYLAECQLGRCVGGRSGKLVVSHSSSKRIMFFCPVHCRVPDSKSTLLIAQMRRQRARMPQMHHIRYNGGA